jgi:hypothetical protein
MRGATSAMGQKAKYSLGVDVFRFTPESGLMSDIAPCPFRARFGLMHRSKSRPIDQPIGADVRGLIRATPLSEDPQ